MVDGCGLSGVLEGREVCAHIVRGIARVKRALGRRRARWIGGWAAEVAMCDSSSREARLADSRCETEDGQWGAHSSRRTEESGDRMV
jgi:hypothetical protein